MTISESSQPDSAEETPKRKSLVKTRDVWFTPADWQAFSDALAEAYPQARYDIRASHEFGHEPAEAIWERRIMDVPLSRRGAQTWAGDIPMIFDPDWKAICETYRRHDDPPDMIRWGLKTKGAYQVPLPFVKFDRRNASSAEALDTATRFDHTVIYYFYLADSKPAAAEMRKFFRLVSKFCTNRNLAYYRLPAFDLPGSEFVGTEAKGSWFWLGHDAIRWAREDPQRMMRYNSIMGIRPVTEEELAQLNASLPSSQSEERS